MQPFRLTGEAPGTPCRRVEMRARKCALSRIACQKTLPKPAAEGAAVLPARLLRRGGAGDRIVERALAIYGAPVYVRHEIVHNRYVVEGLRAKGAVFVEELDEIPDTDAPVIFSAHGVPKSVPAGGAARATVLALDATCPLVTKVHREAEIHHGAAARSC